MLVRSSSFILLGAGTGSGKMLRSPHERSSWGASLPGRASGPGPHPPPRAGATPTRGLRICAQMAVTPMSTERERLVRDINNLKERVSLVWLDMISKRMTPAERQELLNSIESFLKNWILCGRNWISRRQTLHSFANIRLRYALRERTHPGLA